jgi:hypothetical protein
MTTRKPIILDDDGIFSQLPDGEIINAGGTDQSTWTVDGRGLLFDDGTSTSGGGSLTLQTVYNNWLVKLRSSSSLARISSSLMIQMRRFTSALTLKPVRSRSLVT